MTKKQANTLTALGIALILTQILCTGLILRGQERTRKEAEAAQVSSTDTLEMQKQAVRQQANLKPNEDGATWSVVLPESTISGSYETLCKAYLRAGLAREQKQAEIESLKLLEMRLEKQLIKYQILHVSDPFRPESGRR